MKQLILLFLIVGLFSRCKYDGVAPCYHGKVIMATCCTGTTFISIDSSKPIGKNIRLNNQDYTNVIQIPGYDTNKSEVYMNLRKFDPNKDFALLPPGLCYCFVSVTTNAPMFVPTALSYSNCPQSNQ